MRVSEVEGHQVALGWIPDIPDQRDFLFEKFTKKLKVPKAIPALTDLREFCSTVEDQGRLGSCTAQALVGNIELLQRKNKVSSPEDFSTLFLYYNERVRERTVAEDSGAMIRTGIKSLVGEGVCGDILWPYTVSKFTKQPPPKAYTDAATHQILSYYRLLARHDMVNCLASGFPFVFGAAVYESFISDAVADSGKIPMPKRGEQMLGGHAMLAVGYNNITKLFTVRNSWGTVWGKQGYCTMPYAYLESRNLSDDFWTIRAGEQM